ncbi:MAG: FAD-binding oxidoreductase [Vicinamibacterales bacterium]
MSVTPAGGLDAIVGPAGLRGPDVTRDRISSVVPTLVAEPDTPEQVAQVLAWCARERQTVVLRGAGTKMGWGRVPSDVDVLLSMHRLNRVIAHEHGDLTTTVEAGTRLGDLNEALARHGQYLPIDPPSGDGATVGGLLATNDSGPLRHRFGTPRDLIIGIQMATTEGVLAKAGGRVVKNVAGYDLSKLLTGSFGSLAAITSATFKLSPLPRDSGTVVIATPDDADLSQLIREVMDSQVDLTSFEVAVDVGLAESAAGSRHILLRCCSLTGSVAPQLEELTRFVSATPRRVDVVTGQHEHALWRRVPVLSGDSTRAAAVRVSWLPADLDRVLLAAREATAEIPALLNGRAALGAGQILLGGNAEQQAHAVERLRSSSAIGNVVLMRGSSDLKSRVDVWGPPRNIQSVMAALKNAFDPHGVLNAGRGPV